MALLWWLPRHKPRDRQRRGLVKVPGIDHKAKLQIKLLIRFACRNMTNSLLQKKIVFFSICHNSGYGYREHKHFLL